MPAERGAVAAPSLERLDEDLRAGRATVLGTVRDALARAESVGGLGAFVMLCREQAERSAATLDAELAAGSDRGWLHGVPVALKDNIAVAGLPLAAGSRVLAGHVASADAAVARRLRELGAVVVGKTALDEFAFGTVGEGIGNPRAPGRSPGGSSGGSAAAVAAGVCPLALGTDTGGSVRIPAACCGIVGFKPTVGSLPTAGVVPLAWTLDHVGILTRAAGDAGRAYAALAGAGTGRQAAAPTAPRLGVPAAPFLEVVTAPVRSALAAALDRLRAAGVELAEVLLPSSDVALHLQYLIVLAEAAAYHRAAFAGSSADYTEGVREAIAWGERVGAGDYLDAQRARAQLRRDVDRALDGVDALILPTLPIPTPVAGQAEAVLGDGRREDVVSAMLRLTCAFNHSGHPAVSVPVASEEIPAAVQLAGRHGGDHALLALAAALEGLLHG